MNKTALYMLSHPILSRVAQFFAPVLGALCTLFILYVIEPKLLPVVDGFKITSFERTNEDFILRGVLHKHRPCELVAVNVIGVPRNPQAHQHVLYHIDPDVLLGGNAPVGRMTWGPVVLHIPAGFDTLTPLLKSIRVTAIHRCHVLWAMESEYTTIPVESLPKLKEPNHGSNSPDH